MPVCCNGVSGISLSHYPGLGLGYQSESLSSLGLGYQSESLSRSESRVSV